MSESRDSSGLDGKGENTKMKSDSSQGEEETKCGSEEGNLSATETGTSFAGCDQEVFGKTTHGEENIDKCKLQLPLKKRYHSRTMQDHDQTSNDGISESKPSNQTGEDTSSSVASLIPKYPKKMRTPTYRIIIGNTTASAGLFLFKKKLTGSDVRYDWLVIRNEHKPYFPTDDHPVKLQFWDDQDKEWDMDFICYQNRVHKLTHGWKDFVERHDLRKNDVVCFHELEKPQENHYYIKCEMASHVDDDQSSSAHDDSSYDEEKDDDSSYYDSSSGEQSDRGHRQTRSGGGGGGGKGGNEEAGDGGQQSHSGNCEGKETISGRNERGDGGESGGGSCNKGQSTKPAPVVPKGKRTTTVHQGKPNKS